MDIRLRLFPDPVLRSRGRELTSHELASATIEGIGDGPLNLIKFSDDLLRLMIRHSGIGLAAPQVGLPLRMWASRAGGRYVVVNPVLENLSEEMEADVEGCLSVPNLKAIVSRHRSLVIRGKTPLGEPFERAVSGMEARVAQHETDHLDGVMFFDRLSGEELERIRRQVEYVKAC